MCWFLPLRWMMNGGHLPSVTEQLSLKQKYEEFCPSVFPLVSNALASASAVSIVIQVTLVVLTKMILLPNIHCYNSY